MSQAKRKSLKMNRRKGSRPFMFMGMEKQYGKFLKGRGAKRAI